MPGTPRGQSPSDAAAAAAASPAAAAVQGQLRVRLAAVLVEGAEFTAVIAHGDPMLWLWMVSTVYLGATICCGTDIVIESYARI